MEAPLLLLKFQILRILPEIPTSFSPSVPQDSFRNIPGHHVPRTETDHFPSHKSQRSLIRD